MYTAFSPRPTSSPSLILLVASSQSISWNPFTPVSPNIFSHRHYCAAQCQMINHSSIIFSPQHNWKMPKSGRNSAHFPCSLSVHFRERSFYGSYWRCNQSFERPLSGHCWPARNKSWHAKNCSLNLSILIKNLLKKQYPWSLPALFHPSSAVKTSFLDLAAFKGSLRSSFE